MALFDDTDWGGCSISNRDLHLLGSMSHPVATKQKRKKRKKKEDAKRDVSESKKRKIDAKINIKPTQTAKQSNKSVNTAISAVTDSKNSAKNTVKSKNRKKSLQKTAIQSDLSPEATSESPTEFPTDNKVASKREKTPKDSISRSKCLRESMKSRLQASRFRYLNEQVDKGGHDLLKNKAAFRAYHEGFKNQIEKWPENPLKKVAKFLEKQPRNAVVADMGCGEGILATEVKQTVHSFDLVAANPRVTACDMASVPLAKSSVDFTVFCLSLMGENLAKYLVEAHRILRKNGKLIIIEVRSRFTDVSNFVKSVEKLGFSIQNRDESNKMFLWFVFAKTKAPKSTAKNTVTLLPCIYKKR